MTTGRSSTICDREFAPEEVLAGKKTDEKQYFLTDENGQLVLNRQPCREWFYYYITSPGYALYLADWTLPNEVPAAFTAELEPGVSVGGVIVDPDGNPITGATLVGDRRRT